MRNVLWMIPVVCVAACGSDGKPSDPASISKAVTESVNIPGATKMDGTMPEGTSTSVSVLAVTLQSLPEPEEQNATLMGPMVGPGGNFTLPLRWAGGSIMAANVGFGGNGFFQVPAGSMGQQTSGTLSVTGTLSGNVCDNLAEVCHAIRCYEQVQLADGTTYSRQQLQTMVLNCTGTSGCTPSSGSGGNVNLSTCPWLSGFMGGANPYQNNACGQCIVNNCGAAYNNCFGTGWQQGNYGGGACGPYFQCLCNCAQTDTQCFVNCAQNSGQACGQCTQQFGNCQASCDGVCN